VTSIQDCTFLVYGERKIGKTSLCSQFEDALVILFEPGGKGLRLMKTEITQWAEFVRYVDLVLESDRFRTVVIDTADASYRRCYDAMMRKLGIEKPPENDYGATWGLINAEYERPMAKLMNSGRGVVFTSHAQLREIEGFQKIIPSMPAGARRYVSAAVDATIYYGYFGKRRYLTVQGSEQLDAGHRLKNNFWTAGEPRQRVHSIEAFDDKNPAFSEEETYERLVAAFENRQAETGEPGVKSTLTGASGRGNRATRR